MKASKLAQKTSKDIGALKLMVECLLDHADIPPKARKELDESLVKVGVRRSPKPTKGGGLTRQEVSAGKAKEPTKKKGGAKKEKPAQKEEADSDE